MLVYLPRFFVREPEFNLKQFAADCSEAGRFEANLAVFPEQFITGYRAAADAGLLRASFGDCSERNPELLLCCGSISEDGQNRQYWYRAGRELACYSKVHLFAPNGERELWSPGDSYAALELDGLRIGLGTCNDLRFPEQMHELSRAGKLQLIVYPALWPWARDHVWATLLRARAMEHGAFCIGCCVSGVDNGLECFDGAGNYVFDPLGTPVFPQGRLYQLDLELLHAPLVDTQAQHANGCAVKRFPLT